MSGPLRMVDTVGLTRRRTGVTWWKRLLWWNRERKAANPSMATLRRQLLLLQIQETQMRTNALIAAENERFGGVAAREMGTGSIDASVQREEDDAILIACERAMAEAEPVHLAPAVREQPAPQVYTGEDEEETVGRLDEEQTPPMRARA